MGMPVAPAFDFDTFRARTNVPDPSGVDAVFDAGDAIAGADWTQTVDQLIRIRVLVQQTNVLAENHDAQTTEFLLQYNNSGVEWLAVGAVGADVEDVQYIAATGFANGDNTTTARLGSGTLVTGDGREVAGATDSVTFTDLSLEETELEFSIEIVGSLVTDLDTIQLRLLYSNADESPPNTVFEAETDLPTMTVDKPAAAGIASNRMLIGHGQSTRN